MIDKKSILAQFAKSKKPMPEVSVEIEPAESESEGEGEGEEMSGSEMKCPCCGEMISLSAKKSGQPSEKPME